MFERLAQAIPAGVGSRGAYSLTKTEQRALLKKGARWAVAQGWGTPDDIEHTEERGCLEAADPEAVSAKALERGRFQAGTLGAGNHFVEVQVVDGIFDRSAADVLGISDQQCMVMLHTGSRGFGHQVCTDYTKIMLGCLSKYSISVPDRQLACVPVESPEGEAYLAAMACAANYAWANRQVLTHCVRLELEKSDKVGDLPIKTDVLYDVSHNIAKIEQHKVNGSLKRLCVHRKGATRAFGPHSDEIPLKYKEIGQPVLVPGDMGSYSYLLTGTARAMQETFGSACHGAGRAKSRSEAMRTVSVSGVLELLSQKGIMIHAASKETIAEEAPQAYKDIEDITAVISQAGLAHPVCRLRPLGVIKG